MASVVAYGTDEFLEVDKLGTNQLIAKHNTAELTGFPSNVVYRDMREMA